MTAVRRWVRGINRVLRLVGQPIDLAELGDALMPEGIEDLDFNSEEFLSASIPAANGMFTARSLAKMYAALASDGELDGVRLLGRDTLWRATEVQNRGIGRVIPVPMHWRLGYHRVATLGPAVPNGFGHYGFGGSGAFGRSRSRARRRAHAQQRRSAPRSATCASSGSAPRPCAARTKRYARRPGSSTTLIAPDVRSAAVANASGAASSGKRCVIMRVGELRACARASRRRRRCRATAPSRPYMLAGITSISFKQSAKPGSSRPPQ